jgi:hypothetical protein
VGVGEGYKTKFLTVTHLKEQYHYNKITQATKLLRIRIIIIIIIIIIIKVKQSRYRPGVAQRVPGS